MTPFGLLIIGHLVGDFLFQTSWMAQYKASRWGALITHALVYTLCVSLIAWIGLGSIPWLVVAFIFFTHVFIDKRNFVLWWVRNVMRTDVQQVQWLPIAVDQVFHILVLAFVAQFML